MPDHHRFRFWPPWESPVSQAPRRLLSDRGGQRAAVAYSLIQTCRLNDVGPQAWLADVLARIADHPVSRLDELLPWNWRSTRLALAA